MSLNVISTDLPEVLVLEPRVFSDARGFFFESYNARAFEEVTGVHAEFVQDNHSLSHRNVLRGLHYQIRHAQGKLVRVINGEVFDVAVDLRRESPNFGKWTGSVLSSANKRQMWIPPGFAHGFLVLSESAEFLYKTTDYWHAEFERSLRWDDPSVGIQWPLTEAPVLNAKDANARPLGEIEIYG